MNKRLLVKGLLNFTVGIIFLWASIAMIPQFQIAELTPPILLLQSFYTILMLLGVLYAATGVNITLSAFDPDPDFSSITVQEYIKLMKEKGFHFSEE